MNLLFHHAVLVTGLPPSASWQDLKVSISVDKLLTAPDKLLTLPVCEGCERILWNKNF